jgi:hypothetical protein
VSRLKNLLLIAGLVVAPLCIFAQNAPEHSEQNLIALEKMWNQAQLTRDSAALEHLVGSRFINTEWDGEVSNRKKFLADIKDPLYKPTTMSIQDVSVEIYGNTAIVAGVYHTKGSYAGKPYDHVGRFTDTWIYDYDKWQCIASHTSLINKKS